MTGSARRNHIQPVLKELHWLPVIQRVQYKVAVITHKVLSTRQPLYLADIIKEHRPTRSGEARISDWGEAKNFFLQLKFLTKYPTTFFFAHRCPSSYIPYLLTNKHCLFAMSKLVLLTTSPIFQGNFLWQCWFGGATAGFWRIFRGIFWAVPNWGGPGPPPLATPLLARK